LTILNTEDMEQSIKESAGQTLLCLIQYRPKFLAKCDMVRPMLVSLVQLIAKSNASGAGSLFVMNRQDKVKENEEEDDVDDDMLNQQLAQTILDSMAVYIPSKYFTDTALAICSSVCR
jgi:hypothetical protein